METKLVNVVFTNGYSSNNTVAKYTRKVIQWFTKSKYDHAELWFYGDKNVDIKCNNKSLPHHTVPLKTNVLYSSSFTKKGHELITLNKRIEHLKKEKYTGKIYIATITHDKVLFWEDQKKVVEKNDTYGFVWAFVGALDNKLKEYLSIDINKILTSLNFKKIYTKKQYCSAMVMINLMASALRKVDGDLKKAYHGINKREALLQSPEDIAVICQKYFDAEPQLVMELIDGVVISKKDNLIQ